MALLVSGRWSLIQVNGIDQNVGGSMRAHLSRGLMPARFDWRCSDDIRAGCGNFARACLISRAPWRKSPKRQLRSWNANTCWVSGPASRSTDPGIHWAGYLPQTCQRADRPRSWSGSRAISSPWLREGVFSTRATPIAPTTPPAASPRRSNCSATCHWPPRSNRS